MVVEGPKPGDFGYYNMSSREWHNSKKCDGRCHIDQGKDIVTISWKKAKKIGADLCGHEYPGLNAKKEKE